MIPLILRLKKAAHKEMAKLQDILVNTLYEVFNDAVIHGGTSIWRCYNGNRFSEDIDVYISRDLKKVSLLFERLQKKGLIIEKKKISERSIFSVIRHDRIVVRFEAIFKKVNGILKEYETAESNFITIYTLTPGFARKLIVNTIYVITLICSGQIFGFKPITPSLNI